MRLATWNINSIRARADRAVAWLERTGTDVLALQETKCADAQFPYSVFEAAGYEVVHVGASQWNGVAIASRVGLADARTHFAGQPSFGDPNAQIALVGDWNVIPLDTDVWDVTEFAGHTHVTPAERAAFSAFADVGFTEVTRQFVPEEGKYTYWDYQQLAFPKNKGLRIDFAWTSAALTARVTGVTIDREERKGKGASDHVPVVLELAD